MLFSSFAARAALLSGVLAGPTVVPKSFPEALDTVSDVSVKGLVDRDGQLNKRAREGFHFLNCGDRYSALVYCPDDGNCNHEPAYGNIVTWQNIHVWESPAEVFQMRDFMSGYHFWWHIRQDAASQPKYSQVGTARNEDHNDYKVYKDDQTFLYADSAGRNCRKMYYALR